MDQTELIEAKYRALAPRLDEATLRLWAAAEARSLGRGGVTVVAKAAGLSRTTVYAGLTEIEAAAKARPSKGKHRSKAAVQPPVGIAHQRIRAPGGGRKKLVDTDTSLLADLDALVEPTSRAGNSPRPDPPTPICASPNHPRKETRRVSARTSRWRVPSRPCKIHLARRPPSVPAS